LSLLVTAPIGVFLIVVVFFGLRWFMPSRGRSIAVLLGLIALGVYLPLALRNWPGLDVIAMNIALFLITVFILGLMSPADHATRKKGDFHWGPTLIIGFLGTVIVVQVILITIASHGLTPEMARVLLPEPKGGAERVTSFFPGEVPHAYQKKEALFNEYLEQIREQHARGWQVRKGWLEEAVLNKPTPFRLELLDAQGEPVAGAKATIKFMRAADSRLDFEMPLSELEQGVYGAQIALPAPGFWDVLIQIVRDDEIHEVRARTHVKS